jgi:regulator of RNase E activity RraB
VNEIRGILEEFDENWVDYERLYVVELMLIEQDARRFIQKAIDVERDITSAEVRERAKGKIIVECTDHNKNRKRLVEIVNKINAVANPDGKGRDDLQVEILF